MLCNLRLSALIKISSSLAEYELQIENTRRNPGFDRVRVLIEDLLLEDVVLEDVVLEYVVLEDVVLEDVVLEDVLLEDVF